jgi:hypothetical protein
MIKKQEETVFKKLEKLLDEFLKIDYQSNIFLWDKEFIENEEDYLIYKKKLCAYKKKEKEILSLKIRKEEIINVGMFNLLQKYPNVKFKIKGHIIELLKGPNYQKMNISFTKESDPTSNFEVIYETSFFESCILFITGFITLCFFIGGLFGVYKLISYLINL